MSRFHLAFELLAYILGFQFYRLLRRSKGDALTDAPRWGVIAAAALGAAAGSRILAGLQDIPSLAGHWTDPLVWMQGKTVVGGLLGGWLAVESYKKYRGITVSTGDLFALPLVLAIAIGRVGCFLAGPEDRTWGGPSSLPWAVQGLHPAPLYEIAFLLPLGSWIWRLQGSGEPGDDFKRFVAGYLAFRLAVDFLKPAPLWLGLAAIQWACVFGLLCLLPHFSRILRWNLG
jgi:prolipoprotein diacylglyceryltransferase